jgi:structural maintenance of chromosome 2
MINGMRAQQGMVHTLFQSVGLNINNPNFLIMQGRITKVLNMKATEVLAMIEEASGTRMFEERKDKAFKTMSKKDKKVEEINGLLQDEIEPKLDKLRGEKRAFLDFQQTQIELERLTKLIVAHDFIMNQRKAESSGKDYEAKKQRLEDLEASEKRLKNEIANLAEDLKRVKAQREKEHRKGGRYQELDDQVKAKAEDKVRLETSIGLMKENLAKEQKTRQEIEKSFKDLEKSLQAKSKIHDGLKLTYESAKAEFDALNSQAEEDKELLQSLLTGVASKEGQESGYQSQLQGM